VSFSLLVFKNELPHEHPLPPCSPGSLRIGRDSIDCIKSDQSSHNFPKKAGRSKGRRPSTLLYGIDSILCEPMDTVEEVVSRELRDHVGC
jgi:hypothetical protein